MKLALRIIKIINQLNISITWIKYLQKITSWIDKLFFKPPSSIFYKKTTLNGIPVEAFSPKHRTVKRTVFYIHGGGFLFGLNIIYRKLAVKISSEMDARVWLVDYPLLPDNEFPKALHACFQAYKTLVEKMDKNQPLLIMGDSAGGNLVMACMHLLKDAKIPLPQGGVLFSPWLDLTLSGKSLMKNGDVDPIIIPGRMPEIVNLYLKEKASPKHYLASPLYGCLEEFPPLFIAVGEYEVLQDDSLRFAHKAKDNEVQVTVEIGEKMPHDYPILFPCHSQSIKCFRALKVFLESIR